MITINDYKQQALFDPWAFICPKRRQLLDEGWPGLFRTHLLHELPVKEISPFFSSQWGRPSKELYSMLGALLLQQAMDLTDEHSVEHFCFDLCWHYGLDITQESDSAKYICTKTLWSARQLMIENNLDPLLFERTSDKLARVFEVNTGHQRIDSVHVFSNMRRLSRLGIFIRTIRKFLRNLKRQHAELWGLIDERFAERYLAEKTLLQVSADLLALIERFKEQAAVCQMHSYKLMQRVFSEHGEIKGDEPLTVKPAKEVPSDSLQNPSDPEATYDGHKGQGYQVQVMETYTTTADKEQKEQFYYLRYNGKHYRLARRRCLEQTDEFIERYRWRSGIEATMSEYATLTGVKRLRVRGMAAVRYCAVLKAAGLNLMRAARVQRARMKARLRAAAAASQPLRAFFLSFKEQFAGLIGNRAWFSLPEPAQADDGLAWAT